MAPTNPTSAAPQGRLNYVFLVAVDAATRDNILGNISSHYGIKKEEAFEEVSADGAEHLLDYMTGAERFATKILMQRYGFA
jgi:hypothetical protein